jgi:hypothetical protein
VFVEGINFVYSFSLFLANLNDIVHLTKKLQLFEEFGEPRDLASFKNRQNKLMKCLYVNSVGGMLGYSAWSYLEEPTCRRTSFDQYRRETCGVLVPIWVSLQLGQSPCEECCFGGADLSHCPFSDVRHHGNVLHHYLHRSDHAKNASERKSRKREGATTRAEERETRLVCQLSRSHYRVIVW